MRLGAINGYGQLIDVIIAEKCKSFLPRDALLSAVYAVVVCLCVCHTPVLYQNG